MTVSEVVNKLAMEQALALGDLDTLPTCRRYIQMALTIGRDHFNDQMNEIIVYDLDGNEIYRFKGIREAGRQLNIDTSHIRRVIRGDRHSHLGFIFRKDKELVPARESA